MFEQVKRVLTVLEIVEWKWTVKEILEQPADLLDYIITAKSAGENIRIQRKGKSK